MLSSSYPLAWWYGDHNATAFHAPVISATVLFIASADQLITLCQAKPSGLSPGIMTLNPMD